MACGVGRRLVALTIVVLMVGAVSGCTSGADPADLETTWALESYTNEAGELVDASPDVTTNITFSDGTCNGSGGVNTFRGDYEAADDGSLTFGPLASTLMAGFGDAAEQESGFFRALEDTEEFSVENGTLTLLDAEGETLATLTS